MCYGTQYLAAVTWNSIITDRDAAATFCVIVVQISTG
jgi:hypothetical protein